MSDAGSEREASEARLKAALDNFRLAVLRRIVAQEQLHASDSLIGSAMREGRFAAAIETVRAVRPGLWQRMLSSFRLGWRR